MVTIFYRRQCFLLILDGVIVSGDNFVISDYQKHSLLALPLTDAERLLPLCGSIQANCLANITLTDNYDFIHIKTAEYELLPLFVTVPIVNPPKVISQWNFDDILATLYIDNTHQLILEDNNCFISHTIPREIKDINCAFAPNGRLITLRDDEYILIILRDDTDFHLLFERNGCKTVFNDNGLTLKYDFNDTLRRTMLENYSYMSGEYIMLNRQFQYRLNHQYISEALPILLIDAIMVGDYEYAQSILAADLSQNIAALAEFFGKIICYYNLNSMQNYDKSLRLVIEEDGKKVIKTFAFEYNRHHITDINQL